MCEHKYKEIENIEICELCNDINIIDNVFNNDDKCIHNFIYAPQKVCDKCGLSFNEYNDDEIIIHQKKYKHKYNMNRRLNLIQGHCNITYNDTNLQELIADIKKLQNINYAIALSIIKKHNIKNILLRDNYHIYNIFGIYVKPVLVLTPTETNNIKKVFNLFISYWFNNNYFLKRNNVIRYDYILMKIILLLKISTNLSLFRVTCKRKTRKFYNLVWHNFIKQNINVINAIT